MGFRGGDHEISERKTPALICLESCMDIGEIKVIHASLEQLCECSLQSVGQSVSQSVSQTI